MLTNFNNWYQIWTEEATATVRGASEKKRDHEKEDSIKEIDDKISPPEAEEAALNQSGIQHKNVQSVSKPNFNDDNAEAFEKALPHARVGFYLAAWQRHWSKFLEIEPKYW